MNEGRNSDLPLDLLLDQLDSALEDGALDNDTKAFARVALSLCEMALGNFDAEQRIATAAARKWLMEGESAERDKWRRIIGGKIGMDRPLPSPDRLIYSALNSNTGLNSYNAECLAYLGTDLGLTPYDIAQAFSSGISGFFFK
jgi:hypothetical protein